MAEVKLVVIYRRPKDVDAFEKIYQTEHVPLAVARLSGKTKIVATKILDSPQGLAPFHRIAKIYFPSMQALGELQYQACDKTICYPPTSVPVKWELQVQPLDLERSPKALQHR